MSWYQRNRYCEIAMMQMMETDLDETHNNNNNI